MDSVQLSAAPHARVSRLHPEEGYGFLETPDGRELYFHKSSVVGAGFTQLVIGDEVRYAERPSPDGAQVSTVELVSN